MNSQTLGALASDQKTENVFHAFGYSVPVGKDGRRMWPTKFKREMARQMNSGKLSIGDVEKVGHRPLTDQTRSQSVCRTCGAIVTHPTDN